MSRVDGKRREQLKRDLTPHGPFQRVVVSVDDTRDLLYDLEAAERLRDEARTACEEQAERSTQLEKQVEVAQRERDSARQDLQQTREWVEAGKEREREHLARVRVLEEALRRISENDPPEELAEYAAWQVSFARSVLAAVPIPVETRKD